MSSSKIRKKKRERLVSMLFFLSNSRKLAADRWLRGRKEFKEIRKADYVIISPPKAGRTWLRVMLSNAYQLHYGLPAKELLGFDNYHGINPAIPKIRFTHDRYIANYTGHKDSKQDFYDSRIILQIRDPRDIAVSNYHQWINTVNPYKKKLLNIPEHPENVPIFDFVMSEQFGIPRTIAFLNSWHGELEKTRRHLLVRYEDMRVDPGKALRHILEFMELQPTDEEISQVIEQTSFNRMKRMEGEKSFESGSRRLMLKDPDNPDAFKVRRGKVGGYRDYFSEAELEEIDRLIATLPPLYGYLPDAQ